MRHTKSTFIEAATARYGGKYDYSKVDYVNQSTEVEIICSLHGPYYKTPSRHLVGSDCPVCTKARVMAGCRKPMSEEAKAKRRATNLAKYGATTFAGSKAAQELKAQGKGPWAPDARQKAAATCETKFGAKTWAESDTGRGALKQMCEGEDVRAEMSKRAKSDVARSHYKETSMQRCGAEHWTKAKEGQERLHAMFSTDEERKARSKRAKSDEVREKTKATNMARYGTPYYWQSEEGRSRLSQLLSQDSVQQKIIETKRRKGTSNSSKPEKEAYALLVERFGEDDVVSQYKSDVRYPFACDLYIKSMDLFIEINASWLHGFHWFDENNSEDLARLQLLVEKSDQGKPMYARAVYIWTYDDLRKRDVAEKNKLNYLVFWDNDLSDFKNWLESFDLS